MKSLPRPLLLILLISVCCIGMFFSIRALTLNQMLISDLSINGRVLQGRGRVLPLTFPSQRGEYRVRFSAERAEFREGVIAIRVDDCINSVSVNGVRQVHAELPFCKLDDVLTLDISEFLQPGINRIELAVFNAQGYSYFDLVAVRGPLTRLFFLSVFGLCGLGGLIFLGCLFGAPRPQVAAIVLLCVGVSFRAWYLWSSPLAQRGYDTAGHIQYIEYILNEGRIPAISEGWQTYHPPLYYALNVAWLRLVDWTIGIGDDRVVVYRLFSLLLSVSVLYVGFLYTLLLPTGSVRSLFPRTIALGAIIFFPALVYPAAQIGNDTLVLLIMSGALLLLQHWWQTPSMRRWVGICILLTAGVLTKSSMYLLVLVAISTGLLQGKLAWQTRIARIVLLAVAVLLGAGWFLKLRIVEQGQSHVVGNLKQLPSALKVDSAPRSFLTFNPLAILNIPYVDPYRPSTRRDNFLEYEFRTAFMGEFNHGVRATLPAQVLLGLGMCACVALLFGITARVVERDLRFLPPGLAIVIAGAGAVMMRVLTPYAPIQDFRYLAFLVPALVCLAVRSENGLLSITTNLLLVAMSVCSVVFFSHIAFA